MSDRIAVERGKHDEPKTDPDPNDDAKGDGPPPPPPDPGKHGKK